jgi:uncharacterized DUF497 family protein
VEVRRSALKHGVEPADIHHAWANAVRLIEFEYDAEDRLLVIGPDRHGLMLELVGTRRPTHTHHPRRRLRPRFFDYLR